LFFTLDRVYLNNPSKILLNIIKLISGIVNI
jgi:hypothetical protein